MNERTELYKAIFLVICAIALVLLIWRISSSMKRADFECPICGSYEVIDYGAWHGDAHLYECMRCHVKLTDND